MAMTFGIHVGHMGGPMDELRRLWRFADQRGFDWFSASDHFQESPAKDGTGPCFESVSVMSAVALDTARVRIGCLVFCVNYRNPGLLAKALCTIDHLSAGRAECGIGAGWHEAEYKGYGIPFAPIGVRQDQLEEAVQILRMLFDQDIANFKGRHFQLNDARCNPKPLQKRLRIWVGGGGEKRTLRTAARYADGWNAPYLGPEAWKAKSKVLDQWCETERRDPRSIIRTVNVGFYLGADAKGAARGDAIYRSHWKPDEPRTGFFRGTPKDAVEMIAAYRDAGVERLNIGLRQGPYDWEALEAYASEVLPQFGVKRPA
jgi:alkanesulfonate monooxygenase SsuD/methylene tetrahydromethanopterin reductase-like flavin-dependent oxidoreductase (luciferase family)